MEKMEEREKRLEGKTRRTAKTVHSECGWKEVTTECVPMKFMWQSQNSTSEVVRHFNYF